MAEERIMISDSKQRVAYDLMQHIAFKETDEKDAQKGRAYWINLYEQCYQATSGYPVKGLNK
jgi:hypothetical protein